MSSHAGAKTQADDSLPFSPPLLDALVFWLKNQLVFWIAAFPIALLAAAIDYILETELRFQGYRDAWGWNALFAAIYALFLDRWIKISLLEEAPVSDETDELRRRMIDARFLLASVVAFALAWAIGQAPLPYFEGMKFDAVLSVLPHVVIWAYGVALFALLLPAISAGVPTGLGEALRLSRNVRTPLFILISVAALISLVAAAGTNYAVEFMPRRPWSPALMAGASRLVDCLLLAFVGHVLVSLYRNLTGWQPPEPEDRPYRVSRRSS
jgi:hypothetical protein